jgi:hypothetical protein
MRRRHRHPMGASGKCLFLASASILARPHKPKRHASAIHRGRGAMNNWQRTVLVVALCLFALGLPLYFLQYYEQSPIAYPLTADEVFSTLDAPSSGLIIKLGNASTINGIYARPGMTANFAALFGIAIPGLLLTSAAFLWAGRNVAPKLANPIPDNKNERRPPILVSTFSKLWNGKIPLSEAFWGFYICGAIICLIFALLAMVPFGLLRIWPLGFLAINVIMLTYGTVVTIGVWRSATASTPPYWPAAIVKGVLIFWTFGVFSYFADGGLQRLIQIVSQ